MRLLGVDFGFARIGIAVAETEFGIVSARPALAASGTLKKDAKALADFAKKEQADQLVLGLPLEDGEEGKMARICRTLADAIRAHGVPVVFVDETLSSVQAERSLRDDGLKASQRRKLKDGEAARLILERYMHERQES